MGFRPKSESADIAPRAAAASNSETASIETIEHESAIDALLAESKSIPWPEGHTIGECIEESHPILSGRVRVARKRGIEPVPDRWIPVLHGIPVRVGDRVLVLKIRDEAEPVVIGVIDGFRRRPELPKTQSKLELKTDESLLVTASNGQPLLEVTHNRQGPVVKLLQADAQIELPGKLDVKADSIDLQARKGSVKIDASDDVIVSGEVVHLN